MTTAAETLRQAASLLRERAEKARPGPWEAIGSGGMHIDGYRDHYDVYAHPLRVAWCGQGYRGGREDAEYIAMMSPPVALALADWLDNAYDMFAQEYGEQSRTVSADLHFPLGVARAVLGGETP